MTAEDIWRLVGVGAGLVVLALGVITYLVEGRRGEVGCLPVLLVIAGFVVTVSSLP